MIMFISRLKSPALFIYIQFLFVLNVFAQNGDVNTSVFIDLTKATGDHRSEVTNRIAA